MKKGFTLVELIIVVIIIGVLASIALPQYTTAVERAKVGKAKSVLGLIVSAEKMYAAEHNNAFVACANEAAVTTSLGTYIDVANSMADPEWTYIAAATGTATATRVGGGTAYTGKTVTLDVSGTYAGDHPLK